MCVRVDIINLMFVFWNFSPEEHLEFLSELAILGFYQTFLDQFRFHISKRYIVVWLTLEAIFFCIPIWFRIWSVWSNQSLFYSDAIWFDSIQMDFRNKSSFKWFFSIFFDADECFLLTSSTNRIKSQFHLLVE